jgi:tRNA(fMet)-specific endonuclease VapC
MTHLIDSNVLIDFLFDQPDTVALPEDLRRRSGLAISVISYMELLEGIAGGRSSAEANRGFRILLRNTRILVVSRAIASQPATIRLDLRRQKRQVNERAMDILIAATAIEHGLTLVTGNTRDYADIPGIRLYGTQS